MHAAALTRSQVRRVGPRTDRAFRLNSGSAIEPAAIIEVVRDEAAKAATALTSGHGNELWERARRLANDPLHGTAVNSADETRP